MSLPTREVVVVGGGLAGCEAAWQAARRGLRVRLMEMRPALGTPAHRTGDLAELVCSNSLKSDSPETASGILKRELRLAGSMLLRAAEAARVPAGEALAVDRRRFSEEVTRAVAAVPAIEVVREEFADLAEAGNRVAVIATGPLTSARLSHALTELTGSEFLYFYDAISPIFLADSLDYDHLYRASRYDKGEADYWNAPLDREEYARLVAALAAAEIYPGHAFERERFFRACQPVEELARSGPDTLAHGPLRPVGLHDPRTGKRPHAVIQLRVENAHGTLVSPVGFQTRMRHGEQERVFRSIPAFARAKFARYGSIHRNTFVSAPRLVSRTLSMRMRPEILLAGTLVGAEGYVEAMATGWLAGQNAARAVLGEPLLQAPPESMIGALVHHLVNSDPRGFQPMNVNLGLLPPLGSGRLEESRSAALARRALERFTSWLEEEGVGVSAVAAGDAPAAP